MVETRKLAAILADDVVGYSRLAGSDEDRTLARLRGLRSDLIDPDHRSASRTRGKRTGNASITARKFALSVERERRGPRRTTEDRAAVPRVVARGVAVLLSPHGLILRPGVIIGDPGGSIHGPRLAPTSRAPAEPI